MNALCPSYQNKETEKLDNNTQKGLVMSLSIFDVSMPLVVYKAICSFF